MAGVDQTLALYHEAVFDPVVLRTGHSETLHDVRAREIGARCVLMKPVRLQDLAAAVRAAMGGGAPHST